MNKYLQMNEKTTLLQFNEENIVSEQNIKCSKNVDLISESTTILNKIILSDEQKYLNSLNEKEFKAYEIAKKCLGTSFQLEKSNGFLLWFKDKSS